MIVKLFDVKIGNKSGKKAHGMATETSYLRINLYLGFYTAVAVWELLLICICQKLSISSENPHPDLLHPDLFMYKYSQLRGEAETTVWDYLQSRTVCTLC